MDIFWKAIGGALIALILGLVLGKQSSDVAVVLNLLVCGMLLAVAVGFLNPIIAYFRELTQLTELDSDLLALLVKAAALGMLCQITSMLCADAGNSALGKGIELASVCVILWLSLPILSTFVQLIRDTLGQL